MCKIILIALLAFPFFSLKAQDSLQKRTVSPKKVWIVAGANVAVWTGSFIALNTQWYAGYPRSSFHFFNDNDEWEQMDKFGHMWTAYQISRVSAEVWKWTGLSDKQSIIIGGISGIAYQSIIEIQDGFSSEWGFSWGDMTANTLGAAAYVAQQLAWKDQRVQIKLSYWGYPYNTPELSARRDQLFGTSLPQRMLKDYNSQTYWISANLKAFFPQSNLPAWLNVSIGYSADGMLGATQNTWTDNGATHDRSDIPRVRRLFIAPDINLTKIKTKSKLLHSIFFALNAVKFPAPALELNSKGKLSIHGVYY